MFKHHLKVAFRNIIKDKGYSLLNIAGLAIAVSCCFLLLFWVKSELSYETCFPYADRIYRLIEVQDRVEGPHYSTDIETGVINELKNRFPQIEAATKSLGYEASVQAKADSEPVILYFCQADVDFLRMFAFEYIEGSPESAATTYNGVVISEEAAHALFGNRAAVGETIFLDSPCPVSAVVKKPKNTKLSFDVLWIWNPMEYGPHYFMLHEGAKLTPELRMDISDLLKTVYGSENRLEIQELRDVHLYSPEGITLNSNTKNLNRDSYGNLAQLYVFSLAAFIILLMAIINYVNTSISRALSRMKEVGVRKVTGASRGQLIFRFLFEAFITSFAGIIIAMALTELLLPGFSSLLGNRIDLGFDLGTISIALGVCILITILSGSYAAFYLSAAKPVSVLRGGTVTGSKENIRKFLLGVQFLISIAIFICTSVIYKQVNSIFNSDFGVDRNNVLALQVGYWSNPAEYESFIDIIKRENPNIIEATMAYHAPYKVTRGYKNNQWAQEGDPEYGMELAQTYCDSRFAEVFGLEIVEGEFLFHETSYYETAKQIGTRICVINETFRDYLGYDDPIGKIIVPEGGASKIVGVVKDFNFKPLKEKIMPINLSFEPEAFQYCFIRTNGNNNKDIMEFIVNKYKEMRPGMANYNVNHFTVEEDYRKMYEDELRTVKLMVVFAVISFLLSLMGIISMIAFMVEKRSKEIAIRKINGARIWDITKLFSMGIVSTAITASVIAVPVCFLLMSNWLDNYVYRTTLSWWIFVSIPLIIIGMTVAVIAIEIYLMSRQNPIHSLRSE